MTVNDLESIKYKNFRSLSGFDKYGIFLDITTHIYKQLQVYRKLSPLLEQESILQV